MAKFLWSIDDAGSGGPGMVESLRKTCEQMAVLDLRATWFVVPKAGDQPLNDAWRDALAQARDEGHDVQLHGLTHADCYEFGPAERPATDIVPTFAPDFEARRDELLPRYELGQLQSRIEEGLAIFDDRLGIVPTAFRAPCGARCQTLYQALSNVGIGYESAVYVSATGYAHLEHGDGQLVSRWAEGVPATPFRYYHGVIEAPILNEYTWRGAWQRSDEFLGLARADLERAADASDIVVLLAHTHGIANHYDHAWRILTFVKEVVESEGLGSFATFSEVIESGEMDAAVAGTLDDLEF